MIYTFECESCGDRFEANLPMSENKRPLVEPCPLCSTQDTVFRVFDSIGHQYDMQTTRLKRAGDGFNDVLKAIHKASGKDSVCHNAMKN